LQLNWLRASHFFPTGYLESISRFGTQLALIDYVAGVIEDLTDRGARQPCSSFDVHGRVIISRFFHVTSQPP
jgi:hypothetical protein